MNSAAARHLAQANIAYLRAQKDDPLLADYMAELDRINRLADASPGFVWRHFSDTRDPAQREFADVLVLWNMSVWESVEALHAYTYRSGHAAMYAQRKKWFTDVTVRTGLPSFALWWIEAGRLPTVEEGKAKLRLLGERGPTAEAFTFKRPF